MFYCIVMLYTNTLICSITICTIGNNVITTVTIVISIIVNGSMCVIGITVITVIVIGSMCDVNRTDIILVIVSMCCIEIVTVLYYIILGNS